MTAVTRLPLLTRNNAPLAHWRGSPMDRTTFLDHVQALARRLPPGGFAVNYCQDRYRFLVAFAAVLTASGTNLLPASRSPGALAEVMADYPGSHVLCDEYLPDLDLPQYPVEPWLLPPEPDPALPLIPADHLAAIVFTSGSTGKPRPNYKRWADLVTGTDLARRRFQLQEGMSLVATVPPQHMYGLETSILYPLLAGVCVHGGRPFFAEDIRAALARMPAPRILVTTPVHLRVCVEAGLDWPAIDRIISATAPLAPELARGAEATFTAPVMEIYGCSEAGSLASRRLLTDPHWQLYDRLALGQQDGVTWVSGPQLPEPVRLGDVIHDLGGGRFELLGRQEDMINVAGKRASLSDLNHRLNAVAGVVDGVFLVPGESGRPVERLAALVVAPGLDKARIMEALRADLDPVFLPRPLHLVERLPREATGKLPRSNLLALLARLEGRS